MKETENRGNATADSPMEILEIRENDFDVKRVWGLESWLNGVYERTDWYWGKITYPIECLEEIKSRLKGQ
jgi:hypothetical protein